MKSKWFLVLVFTMLLTITGIFLSYWRVQELVLQYCYDLKNPKKINFLSLSLTFIDPKQSSFISTETVKTFIAYFRQAKKTYLSLSQPNTPLSVMQDLARKKISFSDYLELEEQAEAKHEYHDGFVWAMAGGSPNHGIISGHVFSSLSAALRKKKENNCRPINGELKVYIESVNRGVYPDAMVVCGEFEFYAKRKDVITNPKLIVEVLSPSTAAFDRGAKFRFYKSLPSFREYILVHQDQPFVEGYYWENREHWHISHAIGLEENIYVHSIDAEISLKDIYAFIEFSSDVQMKLDL